jgi:hypothetical protein
LAKVPPRRLGALRLTVSQLAVTCALLTAPDHDLLHRTDARTALAQLRSAGVVTESGRLSEQATTPIRVVALPVVRIEATVVRGDSERELRVWADERDAVVGTVEGDAVELEPVAWERFPGELGARLGLASRRPPQLTGERAPLPVPPPLLSAVRARVRDGDVDGALGLLGDRGLAPRVRGEALAIAEELRLTFSLSAAWREADGELHVGTLAALEAGVAGWWTFAPDDPADGLRPSDPEAIAAQLLQLLPR